MKDLKNTFWLTIVVFVIFSCGDSKEPIEDTIDKNSLESSLQTKKGNDPIYAAKTNLENIISVIGYIDVPPANRASISPYFGGFVKEIRVLPGQKVKKGDVLLTLENPDFILIQQEYLETKEQLEYLKTDYERQKVLSEERIASAKNFKKAESEYKVMLARYNSLKEQMTLMGLSTEILEEGRLTSTVTVRASIAGNVTSLQTNKSAFADAKTVAIELVNTDHLHLELDIYEKDALKVKSGQALTFRIPESGDHIYQGEVHLVGKSIDPVKRTVKVHGHILDTSGVNFIPGMFVEAEIQIE